MAHTADRRAVLEARRDELEAELRGHARTAALWIAVLVACFGVNVYLAAYNIVTPGGPVWVQTAAVAANIASAVYGWHVVRRLAFWRARWLSLLAQIRETEQA